MLVNASMDYTDDALNQLMNRPPHRRLRGYAFDPSMSLQLDTVGINHAIFEVPWESRLDPGPCGEYLEVVDYDPASGCWYDPVDLNNINLLAQDGYAPSEGNPQFHQQMVYAVAMNTISNFERALGRQVFWSSRDVPDGPLDQYVQRLRIYPHALRAANAYYSPQKKALLFGYFYGPTGTVFSCLSQDIIAHETTHALLDGMHRRYIHDNHPDTLAFHEAFADLVALFQHFTFPDVLKHQIERTRGDLGSDESLLSELAHEFGVATGRYSALRNAIREQGSDGKWHAATPDPCRLEQAVEPHERGAILVAAMFTAFLEMYKVRTRGVIALASLGSGQLPAGNLHPSLVEALGLEATKTARHFLQMAIRALDYCPPFDITFGDYLRALVTADYDMVPNDRHGYRVALIESFRRWGILPDGLKTLSEEQLRWPYARLEYEDNDGEQWNALAAVVSEMSDLLKASLTTQAREDVFNTLKVARAKTHRSLNDVLSGKGEEEQRINFMKVTGIDLRADASVKGMRYRQNRLPSFQVHSVLPTLRVTPDGKIMKQLIISVVQRLANMAVEPDRAESDVFDFLGGATLIFDMDGKEPSLRYAITRPIGDVHRLNAIRAHRLARREQGFGLNATYADDTSRALQDEPFCFLHSDH